MADDRKTKRRRLSPRDKLRLFHAPHEHRTTRREVIGGLLGVVGVSCSETAPQPPAGAMAPVTPAPEGNITANAGAMNVESQPVATPPGVMPPAQMPGESRGDVVEMDGIEVPSAQPEPAIVEQPEPPVTSTMGRSAYDIVELGNTGIRTSRLAMGSGTTGYDGSSAQTRMGADFTRLLLDGYERGIRFFETADAYGSHTRVREAMAEVGRSNVTLLTKTMAETRQEAEADLQRFMEELGTDYFDIMLLHIRTSANWVEESAGAMEVLSEAKARGQIRAHGVSCHSLEALHLAGLTDWVDLDLARINPWGLHMDADPETVIAELESMKASGKAVLGMKILAQGDAVNRFDEAIEHATRLECIHGFTIGFMSIDQLDQVATKIASV